MPLNMVSKSAVYTFFEFIESLLAFWSLGHGIHDALPASVAVLGSGAWS